MGFLGGAMSGYTSRAKEMSEEGKRGILRRKRKERAAEVPITGKVRRGRMIGPHTFQVGKPEEMKRGGKVRKTGKIKLHRGEKVIPAKRGKRGRAKGRY